MATLTVKQTRRKRPSFSPRKAQKSSLPEQSHSATPTKRVNNDYGINSVYHTDTSSLEFKEFSLLDVDDSEPLCSKWHDLLFEHLQRHYAVQDMWIMPPFLVLRCSECPDPVERPFTVSGCIAVWIHMDDPVPPFIPGHSGADSDFDRFIEVDEALVDDLNPSENPKPETLFSILTNHFPDAVAISSISTAIIVEFEEISKDAWAEKLECLPCAFKNIPHILKYSNGILANAEFKRLKAPNPRILKDSVVDDTDYVSMGHNFNPGAMLCSDQGDAITAGVLVQKGAENRLTVAFHCWDNQYEKNPDNLGDANHFRVMQADSTVGNLLEHIDSTNIGLAKLSDEVSFSNRFLDIDTVAKVLVPSSQVQRMDQFYIDSFVTGRQLLSCVGCRVLGRKRGQDFLPDRKESPPDGKYIIMHQGIYATNDPEVLGSPKLRSGICGSALIRLRRAKEKSSCLDDGEICGIMHWAGLAMKYSTEATFYCFADPVDPLIENGWKCVPVAEKHVSAEDDIPAKRRQLEK